MSQRTAGAAAPRHYLPTTLTPHRYQRTRRHLATTLQLYGRWCARPTAMWQDRLAMWPPVMMVNSSKLDEPSMQARKPGHRASLRRHRTHTVVRSHQYDTLRPYARRLRGRVFKRSPPYFSLFRCDPLSAKTICPSGNCSPMAFWFRFRPTTGAVANAFNTALGIRPLECLPTCSPVAHVAAEKNASQLAFPFHAATRAAQHPRSPWRTPLRRWMKLCSRQYVAYFRGCTCCAR